LIVDVGVVGLLYVACSASLVGREWTVRVVVIGAEQSPEQTSESAAQRHLEVLAATAAII